VSGAVVSLASPTNARTAGVRSGCDGTTNRLRPPGGGGSSRGGWWRSRWAGSESAAQAHAPGV